MSGALRIVVAADSLALPRRGPDQVSHRGVWPSLLSELLRGPHLDTQVLNQAQRGLTLPALVQRFDDLVGLWEADVLVLQVGIVDCGPRVFGLRQQAFLSRNFLPEVVRRTITGTARRFRRQIIKLRPGVRYTAPRLFRKCLVELGERLQEQNPRVLVLPILGTTEERERRSPGYSASVALYNDAWREWCLPHQRTFLEHADIFAGSSISRVVAGDGYHLTPAGHRQIAEALAAVVRSEARG